MIDKWLAAGVLEDGSLSYSTEGTPEGGVISPLLANIYLHNVLDEWIATVVGQHLKGRYILVRYADDLVMAFEDRLDAKRPAVVADEVEDDVLDRPPAETAVHLHWARKLSWQETAVSFRSTWDKVCQSVEYVDRAPAVGSDRGDRC